MAERREIYGERIISPELNLRQQGIGADLADAWGESLPAYGVRWADSLLDPTPDYIDPSKEKVGYRSREIDVKHLTKLDGYEDHRKV